MTIQRLGRTIHILILFKPEAASFFKFVNFYIYLNTKLQQPFCAVFHDITYLQHYRLWIKINEKTYFEA